MSTPKHTPGPWRTNFESYAYSDGSDELGIDSADGRFVGSALTKEDARLIAAAPELLRELRSLLIQAERAYEQDGSVDKVLIDQCYATIAKAGA